MRAPSVLATLLLSTCVLPATGFSFPSDKDPAPRNRCQTKDGGVGECVSLLSRRCTLFFSAHHLLLHRPRLCALHANDAIVCCPIAAVRGAGGGTTAGATQRTTTFRPTRPPGRTTRPATTRPTRPPTSATRPPTAATRPTTRPTRPPTSTTSPPTRPTRPLTASFRPPARPTSPPTTPPSRPTRPTRPSRPRSSTRRNLQEPIGLRPRPSLAPIIVPPSPRTPRDHRLPGCGLSRPIAAFHALGDYFQQRPTFARSERVLLGTQPWTALVGVLDPEGGGRWICAGALVTPRIVLTSAHCAVLGGSPDRLVVGLGEHDLASQTDGVAGTHGVLAMERHEAWTQPARRHALALLLLARPADQSPLIQPVCLPPPDPPLLQAGAPPLQPVPGSGVLEVGYDLDSTGMNDRSARSRLAATPATVAPLGNCSAALAASPLGEFLFPGGPQPGPDLCLAASARCDLDAGGPLVAAAADGAAQLEGLQLLDGCTPGQPRLVLRVRHYVPYIVETIGKLTQLLNTV